MPPFNAHFTRTEVRIREEVIIKYIISLIKDARQMPGVIPFFLEFGIIYWAWPLRFVKGNEPFKGYKYYSELAYDAILHDESKFTRDHIFPKKQLKEMLFGMENPNPDSIREKMEKYGEVCVITREEHSELRNARLDRAMPNGWTFGDDIFARYQEIGIQVRINDQQW
jgi:hypothetical protein